MSTFTSVAKINVANPLKRDMLSKCIFFLQDLDDLSRIIALNSI